MRGKIIMLSYSGKYLKFHSNTELKTNRACTPPVVLNERRNICGKGPCLNIGALPRRCRPQVTHIDMHGALYSRSAKPRRLTRGLITAVSRTELKARESSVI